MTQVIEYQHRHKKFQLKLTADGGLELWMDGVVRKRRDPGREPQYVWTNVELEWEEHHYIEARYWASENRLHVTINGDSVIDQGFTEAD